jgi:AbrB family looped-hinge helix DNA binding protein
MHPETSCVTTKGQIVIPARLRRQFNVKQGTRVVFEQKKDGWMVRPITTETIDALRGMLKTKPGEKPVTQQLLEERDADRNREEG